jgi:hypothetical protein
MQVQSVLPGTLFVDSLAFSQGGTLEQAKALSSAGAKGVYLYGGVAGSAQVEAAFGANLGVMLVTLANAFNGQSAVAQRMALGLPSGSTVQLDVEGVELLSTNLAIVTAEINAWCEALVGAGDDPGGYIGVPQPFTSAELWNLAFKGYWRGQGRIVDRNNALSEPSGCGWWAYQAYPSQVIAGLEVDWDMITTDYLGRTPSWVVNS